jgi:malonyl-CoA/methylmalonyl-CoA synthetase
MRIVDPDLADAGRIADVPRGEMGELLFRGPNLFSGYWRRPAETAAAFAAGYFRSGDLGVEEPDGMVRIAGRRSLDVIKSAGFKIGAVEIESCLQEHPAVAEVAVVGMPDSDRGEIVVAVVTTTGAPVEADELARFARARLAPHKIPARIVFRAEIPRTGPGKFDKRALIAALSAGDV